MLVDLFFEKHADVAQLAVARGVERFLVLGEQILPGPFRHDDHRMLPGRQPPLELRQQAIFALQS